MGVKRSFEEEFEEASPKHAKQLHLENKLTSFVGLRPSHDVSKASNASGEGEDGFNKSQLFKGHGDNNSDAASDLADKELETSAPLSWVTRSSSEEDGGSGEPSYPPLYQEYFEFNFPRRTVVQFEDAYSAMLNSPPRKQIPVGPNHQADVPLWCPDAALEEPRDPSHSIDNENEQNVLGTPVLSPSDSGNSSYGDIRTGQGRKDCGCLDEGSIRCVRQHVKDARERLREVFGEEKFAELGFYDMGDEVALRWTEEEERIFHGVIFSNPVSRGRKFWRQLSAAFPLRTKKELVSYYFNVFMLRRRAVQNRSNLLDIDSDDDEWHGNVVGFDGVEDDEDCVVKSFSDQDLQEGSEDENDNEGDDKNDDDDNDSDDGEGEGDYGSQNTSANAEDATGKHDLSFQNSKPQWDGSGFLAHNNMVYSNHIVEDCGVQEYSSTSSETLEYRTPPSFDSVIGSDSRESFDFRRSSPGSKRSNHGSDSDSVYLLETYDDAHVWDNSCSTGFEKNVDFLPTCNMIEEIFGPCSSNSD